MSQLAVVPEPARELRDNWQALLCEQLAEIAGLIGSGRLGAQLPPAVWERVLVGPARDMLARPGKQFRANLVRTGWRLAGAPGTPPPALSAAIEILHAGSLVIDDIEDGAEQRRGAPALHQSHGVPLALNLGNWMYFVAFELLDRTPLAEPIRAAMHRAMLRAVLDCHGGQALDIGHDVTRIGRRDLRAVVACTSAMKAGALTRLATELGALAAGAEPASQLAIGELGAGLGLALQMLDDLGSVTTAWRLDKSREDLWGLRPTWAWVWAAESADDESWHHLVGWARDLAHRRSDPEVLARCLAGLVSERGRAETCARLAEVKAALRPLADTETHAFVLAELSRLEASYG